MNQGKLEVVKQEMARVNVDILGISELKWTGKGEFNSDDHYVYYCGQESLGRNGVALRVNKTVWNAVLRYSLKNDRMTSVCFQGKPFNITVIQVNAPTSNPEETEVEWFYEDLQELLELTPAPTQNGTWSYTLFDYLVFKKLVVMNIHMQLFEVKWRDSVHLMLNFFLR